MAENGKKGGIPPGAWFLIFAAIFGLGAFYARVIPEDDAPVRGSDTELSAEQDTARVEYTTSGQNTLVESQLIQPTVQLTQTTTISDVEAIVGTWRSDDDDNFTRMFGADGSVTDRYFGDPSATERGTWTSIDPAQEDVGVSADVLSGIPVLKLTFANGQILYYGLSGVSADKLTLIYLARGNSLDFTKVK